MCHQFLSLEQEAENDNDLDRTLDNSGNALEDSNNDEEGGGGDSWISFDQFRRSFSSQFSPEPPDESNQGSNGVSFEPFEQLSELKEQIAK